MKFWKKNGLIALILNSLRQPHNSIPALPSSSHPDVKQPNNPITEEEVSTSLRKAPNNKAVGINNIDPSYLMYDTITAFLLVYHSQLLTENWDQILGSNAWSSQSLYRPGQDNKRDPLSYRGIISLQSTLLKLYASIPYDRLIDWECYSYCRMYRMDLHCDFAKTTCLLYIILCLTGNR